MTTRVRDDGGVVQRASCARRRPMGQVGVRRQRVFARQLRRPQKHLAQQEHLATARLPQMVELRRIRREGGDDGAATARLPQVVEMVDLRWQQEHLATARLPHVAELPWQQHQLVAPAQTACWMGPQLLLCRVEL